MKLSRPGAAPAPQNNAPQEAGETKVAPKGWGQPAGGGNAGNDNGQKEAIQERINPEANRSAFSRGVQDEANAISAGDNNKDPEAEAPKTTRTRRASAPREDQVQAGDAAADAFKAMLADLATKAGSTYLRMEAVKAATAFKDSFEATDDMFALADEILAYVNKD